MSRDAKQVAEVIGNDWRTTFHVVEQYHTPSWNQFDEGSASFEAMMVQHAKWLSLLMIEGGAKSRRQTMMTLTPESGRKLYEFLKTQFGDDSKAEK